MVKLSKVLPLLFVIVAFAVGVCVADSSAATQGVTKDKIKIGMYGPFTGTAALYGKIVRFSQAVYMDVNDRGGVNGRKFEFVVEDDAGDPANAPVIFRKLIESDKVFMIHGGPASAATIAGKPLVEQSGIPFIVQSAVANKITDPPVRSLFTAYLTVANMSGAVADFARSMKPKRISVITQRDEWGKDWRGPFIEEMKQSNIQIVNDEEINTEIGDATSLVRIVMRQRPDVIALFAYPQPTSVFLRDAYSQGLRIPVVTGSGAMPPDVLRRINDREPLREFFAIYANKYPMDSPQYDPYRRMVEKYFPNVGIFDAQSMASMTGALANIEVIRRLGDNLTWENWIRGMENLKDFDTPILAGPVSYKPFDPKDPSTRRGIRKAYMSCLNPDPKGETQLIVKDWNEYKKLSGK